MKNIFVLLVAGLLWSACAVHSQPSWMRKLPHGAGCPDCAPPDDSSSVRLMAQASPINRGEKISAAATSVAPQTNSTTVGAVTAKGETNIGFNILAGYRLSIPQELENNSTNGAWADTQINAMIPTNVMVLDHQQVSVAGFMIPLEFEKGRVISFMLAESPPACCFATIPQMNEWVEVHVKSPGVPAMDYSVVHAHGALSVGAKRDNGTLTSIYRMEAEAVTERQ